MTAAASGIGAGSDAGSGSERNPVERIEVDIRIGEGRMSATDDPIFLGIRGRAGREFRLQHAEGASFRRGADDRYVLAGADATNVEYPELNDPTTPALDAADIVGFYIRKGMAPIPNVRGIGELDDRVEVVSVEVVVHAGGLAEPLRFFRLGPVWLGLACGSTFEVPREGEA